MIIGTSTTSGVLAASAVVSARPAAIASITLLSDGTNAGTVIIYDNATAASGTVLAEITGTAASKFNFADFSHPVEASKGLYASISGTGASAIITYIAQ